MNKTLHIVSDISAAGAIKMHLKGINSTDKVAEWSAPLMYGPLFSDFSDKELKRRAGYLNKLFGHYDYDPYSTMHNIVNCNFDKYEKVVVWHGNNVNELLLLYMLSSLTKGRLYEADITELYELFPHFKSTPVPLAVAYCSEDNIRIMYHKIKPISEETKAEYVAEWNRWAESDAPLRLKGNDNTIFEADEDYFDSSVLSACTTGYTKAARVIVNVFMGSNQLISDVFLTKRISWLIRQNKLSACNNKEFEAEIEESNSSDPNKIVVNGVNVTQIRFFSVKLS